MKYLRFLMTLIVLIVSQQVLYAQSYFDDFLKDQGLSFKKPKGYQLIIVEDEDDEFFEYYCFLKDGREDDSSGDFYLYNKDKSVIILIQDDGYHEISGLMIPYSYDGNKIFYNNAIFRADTTKYPLRFYGSDELGRLNADGAAELTRNCNVPGNVASYPANRSIYISKANQGNFNLIYLFKDASRTNQNKIINETKNMLVFVDKKKTFNGVKIFDKHYITATKIPGFDTLATLWNRGSVYNHLYYFNREQYAYSSGNIMISVQFPVNKEWPYYNKETKEIPPFFEQNIPVDIRLANAKQTESEKWAKANEEFKQYLTLAKGIPTVISQVQLSKADADQGYIFDFEHPANDLYRDKYTNCRVVMLHKNNIGTILLKYYYRGDKKEVDTLIEKTWGFTKFKEKAFFSEKMKDIQPF